MKEDSSASAYLMEAFYRNLKTMQKDEALRRAQLELRASFNHPFHWAAFILVGDWK